MSYDLLFSHANSLYESGQLDDAENIYRQILETAPSNADVLNMLGLIAQAKSVHPQAVEYFYKATQNAANHAPIYFNLGISLRAMNKPYEAIEAFKKVLLIMGDLKEAHNQIGLSYIDLNKTNEARSAFFKALGIDNTYNEAKANLAITYKKSDINKAISLLSEIKNDVLAYYYLAEIYIKNKELDKALEYARLANGLNAYSDDIKALIGNIYLQQQNYEEAVISFEKALIINPKNVSALINLANILVQNKEYEQAEEKYKKALSLDVNNFEAHHNYAIMLYNQARTAEALEEFRAAIVINPSSAEASNNLGLILKDEAEYIDALGLFFNALSLNSEIKEFSVNILETLMLLFEQNQDEAKKIAQNWLKHYPNNDFAKQINVNFGLESSGDATENIFDVFADNYENVLEQIEYSLPKFFAALLKEYKGNIIELGCGTGLIAEAIKTDDINIIGVDISSNMLKKAEEKKVYAQLVKSDLIDYLKSSSEADLILMADVLGYIKNISEVFENAKKDILFSFESLDNGECELSYNGRFKHSLEFIKKELEKNNYSITYKKDLFLRKENNIPVKGFVIYAKKNS